MVHDCVFCKVVSGALPANKVYETERVVAFRDISPEAPQHILVIPKAHIKNIIELEASDSLLLSEILKAIQEIAKEQNIDKSGFRVVTNTGEEGGQTVSHLHFHLLGGRPLKWPPG